MGRLTLIGGGVRSGKSRFALELALARGPRLGFVATAQAYDEEMEKRIAAHQEERADAFTTMEAPTDLIATLEGAKSFDAVVVDCLTLWLSNLLLRGDDEPSILAQVDALAALDLPCDLIIVTNEVGMGIVPESSLGRAFRDIAGRAHQRLSARSDELYASMLGTILRLKPGPITIAPRS